MDFHQFQLVHDVLEDRILLRLSFRDQDAALHEVRGWLTRRMVRNLWPNLIEALETRVTLHQPGASYARSEIMQMEHQASLSEMTAAGSFSQSYDDSAQHFPLGAMPLVICKVEFQISKDVPVRINFLPAQGQGFEVGFPVALLHGFCTMLQNAVQTAEWDMSLLVPGLQEAASEGRILN